MLAENSPTLLALPPRPRWLDRQGSSTPFAGALLLLISFTTNYGDDNLFQLAKLPAHVQIGMGLHLAALAALAGDVQLQPVYDIEQRELESEKRTKHLESEFEQRELERDKRLKLLKKENERLAALESRLDALLLNADSSSQTPPATGSN